MGTKISLMSLPASKRRVRLAKDVIKLLMTNHITARQNTYLRMGWNTTLPSTSLNAWIETNRTSQDRCEVCAVGALFVADVMLRDRMDASQVNGLVIKKRLRRHFGRVQLGLIECAFEKSSLYFEHPRTSAAKSFCNNSASSEDRMIAIMKNIIHNKGNFKP